MVLGPITGADEAPMLDMLTSEQIRQTYMLPDFPCREAAVPLFRRLCALSEAENRFVRGIFVQGIPVGFLNDVEITDGTIELGYVIHPDFWGRGYATAALKEAIRQLLALGYRQVICGAFAENAASIRVMEKAGMVRLDRTDGIDYRGQVHRCIYYGICDSCIAPG